MSLNDKIKRNTMTLVVESESFNADETPTPTRLIRNCEEVGLFQDLQNVNPFDETFRKAVELGPNHDVGSKGSSNSDDTLHTPIIFASNAGLTSDLPVEVETVEVDPLMDDDSLQETDSNSLQKFELRENHNKPSDFDFSTTKTVYVTVHPLRDSHHVIAKNNSESIQIKVSKQLDDTKSRLKTSIMSKSSTKNIGQPVKSKSLFEEKEKSRSRSSTHSSSDEVDKETMLKRERNRVAAMRSRKKRKTWVEQLEKSAGTMQTLNTKLQTEVTCLRAEVAQLKTLLLAHKDCPVTRAMTQAVPECNNQEPPPIDRIIKEVIPEQYVTQTKQMYIRDNSEKIGDSKLRILLQKQTSDKVHMEVIQCQPTIVTVKSNSSEEVEKMNLHANCDLEQFIPVIKCNPNAVQSKKQVSYKSLLNKRQIKTEATS